ncbi:MAG: hypothetical protein AAF616_01515 [Bacteroidota bacterium]
MKGVKFFLSATIVFLVSLFRGFNCKAQEIDRTDFQEVAKYYTENFYTGNYTNAMKLLVKDGRANGIEVRCVELGACEQKTYFTYKLYGERPNQPADVKALLIHWTEGTYIEVQLQKQPNGTWLVLGSPAKPSEKAKPIKS